MRRYGSIRPSRGTTWSAEVRAAIHARDRGCVASRAGFPGHTACTGSLEIDHVRASGAMGMKSRSTEDNGVVLCGSAHRWKTEHGREARPLLLAYLERFYPAASPAAGEGMDGGRRRA